ncbi:MAG: carboxypeptidase regulatory-like domain-containing protein [Armatimonadota bacterium]|nr:carboxypeptidase regulatory-like domain-containing protein [bacterium]MDW8321129.1 carboxypeptidase regulatory-like domain-containing protein [Armatimonadota bacterium]
MRTVAFWQLAAVSTVMIWLTACGGTQVKRGSIAGTVTDINEDPVVGARVWVEGAGETVTNMNGAFLLTDVPEGFKNVRASARIGSQDWSGVALVQVFEGDITRNANITLCPTNLQGSIEGFVLDPYGGRVEGARVFAAGALSSAMAVTDRSGYYRIDGLRGGYDYPVVASAPGFLNDRKTVSVVAGQITAASFALGVASGVVPSTPDDLDAVAWTMPRGVTRSASPEMANALEAIKRLIDPQRAHRRAVSRATPLGSLIEIDLTWDYVEDNRRLGYGIYRGRSANPASVPDNAIAFLRDPLASLFLDLDLELTPAVTYYYQVVAVGANFNPDTGAGTSAPSNNASATPLAPMSTFSEPATGATVRTASPTLRWERLSGASTYQVLLFEGFPEINRDPLWPADLNNPGNSKVSHPNNSTVYTGPALQPGQTYYWVVVAFSADGAARSISPLWKFTYRP